MAKKAVIITGGAKRVGAALARYFAEAGYDIALHYNRSSADAKKLKKEIEKLGRTCALFAQDLSDIKALPKLMKQVQKALPHCTALVNNASVFERAELMETDEALFDRQFTVNFKAPFFLTQAFAKTFGKGCIINMLDTDIAQTQGSHFAYLLSKKVLADFTEMAARALGPDIRVNGVCPGIMLPSKELDMPYMKKLSQNVPLEMLAGLEHAVETVRWLCEQKTITGQLLFTDGGQHLL